MSLKFSCWRVAVTLLVLVFALSSCSSPPGEGKPIDELHPVFYRNSVMWALDVHSTLLRSSDNGRHFMRVMPRALEDKPILTSFVRNEKEAWLIDLSGDMYQTSNGGAKWMKRTSLSFGDELNPSINLFFLDHFNGWMVRDETLYRTWNGGKKWAQVNTNETMRFVRDLQFGNEEKGWLSKEEGIFQTEDGGETWEKLKAADPGSVMEKAIFYDEHAGTLQKQRLGGGQSLDITSDGGRTWRPLPSLSSDPSEEIAAIGRFFLVGSDSEFVMGYSYGDTISEVYFTRDQGQKWVPLDSKLFANTYDFSINDEFLVILSKGESGMLMRSYPLDDENAKWIKYRPVLVER
ncbi:YCF48-related protein [Gorillibacterium sp. CAU 1737]|uniref:YCF48-related protein n=1 Tax=Gorillibacterium sp. CAU 1737 TaxID=3140362 RepID=UPI00325FF8BD